MTAPTTPNAELAYRVLDVIDAFPEQWEQGSWTTKCGTSFCFAGWALKLTGHELVDYNDEDGLSRMRLDGKQEVFGETVRDAAMRELGIIRAREADELFEGVNSRATLGELVEEFFGPRPTSFGSGCRCDYLGTGTPEHTPSALCRSLRPDADRDATGGDL